ncbi:MAG: hypothetical protein K2Q34_04895 [Alphaproteobacteria bacterium]|nr:hypothetical protein [Alphaproteobacteria bacterium]
MKKYVLFLGLLCLFAETAISGGPIKDRFTFDGYIDDIVWCLWRGQSVKPEFIDGAMEAMEAPPRSAAEKDSPVEESGEFSDELTKFGLGLKKDAELKEKSADNLANIDSFIEMMQARTEDPRLLEAIINNISIKF